MLPSHTPPSPGSSTRVHRLLLAMLAGTLLCACARADDGVRTREVRFERLPFRVVRIDLRQADLALYWRNPDNGKPFGDIGSLQQWGENRGRRLLFAANAGIYDGQHAPLGLYVEDGKTRVPLNTAHGDPRAGNFSLLPNGVFAIDHQGHASVRTTRAFAQADAHPRWATQSGPMLVIDGRLNPQFIPGSDSLKWRSGVCARTPRQVVFAVSESPVNFDTFARLFRDKLDCRDALYLDGTISQVFVNGNYYGPPGFMIKPYAGMFAVFARPPEPADP